MEHHQHETWSIKSSQGIENKKNDHSKNGILPAKHRDRAEQS
jgi:hypothetical protein